MPVSSMQFGDVAGMASSLDALIDSPKDGEGNGRARTERAEKLFTADRVVPQYEALYRRVMSR